MGEYKNISLLAIKDICNIRISIHSNIILLMISFKSKIITFHEKNVQHTKDILKRFSF